MYAERASRVPGATVWTSIVAAGAGRSRVLPDGCMDLIVADGAVLVAGPDTTAHFSSPGTSFTGLRFAPGFAPRVLGVPASELTDQLVSLDALWSRTDVAQLAESLEGDAGAAFEDAALRACRAPDATSDLIESVVVLVRAGRSVQAISDATGVSRRQLQRCCNDAFGYGAQTLARILRLQRALRLADGGGLGFGELAALAGYADQPHLSREVRALAGVPLGQLVSSGANRSTELPSGSRTTA